MNKGKLGVIAKKILIWLMIIVSVLVGVPVFAEVNVSNKTLSMRNSKSLIDEAAQAQVIADVMRKCLGSVPGNGGKRSDASKDTIFNADTNAFGDETNVSSGRWLEDVINANDKNGEIECYEGDDKILTLFANLLKLDKMQVLCNKDNTDYPGLVTNVAIGQHGAVKTLNYGCAGAPYSGKQFSYNHAGSTNTVYGQEYTTGEEYIKILYNHWWEENISRNPYLIGWSKLDDFSYVNSYYILLNDYGAQCGFNKQPNDEGRNIVTIREISDDGAEESNFYQYGYNGTAISVTGKSRSCHDLADAVNGYYDDYKAALKTAFQGECNKAVKPAWKFVYDQAVVILSDSKQPVTITAVIDGKEETWTNIIIDKDGNETVREFSEEDKNNAKSVKESYESMADGRYRREALFADVSNSPWTCKAPSGYEIASEEYTDPGETIIATVEPNCANSGGAESLGWIICPILDLLSKAATDFYNNTLEPRLQVNTKLLFGTNGNLNDATKQGWDNFQNFANIIFVLLFMVVIFSQLTGIGIDNYGIKKILPKLIVTAVLINLSYYICVICVDLSNILGNGFRALFDGLPVNVPQEVIKASGSGAGATLISAGILTLLVGTIIVSLWKNPALILSLLVGALGVFIAFVFLFVLLAGREAAILVLTVISPLAFVCFILPNTKKLFDKWLKFWEGLLLVYPICGLLVGGGNYVSRLLISSGISEDGWAQAITAMLVGVIPIFLIPTVLKGAFAAMGSIGAKFSGLGDKMRGKATSKLRDSEGYKAAKARSQARKNRINAGLDKNYKPTAIGNAKARFARTKFGKAVGYAGLQKSRIVAAKKTEKEGIEGETALRNLQLERANNKNQSMSTEEYLNRQLEDAVNKGDESSIFAVIDQMRGSNMQASHIAQATRNILGSRTMNKNFLERFAKTYGGDFLKKDFEQLDWARKGGISSNGVNVALGAGGQWMQSNIGVDDMKDEDVAALSSDRLADFIAAGKITRPQAQRVWAANGNMDDTNRLMLGAYSSEGRALTKAQAQAELTNPTIMSAEQVKAYTERAATNTVIEDVRLRDVRGRHAQTDRLGVETEFHIEHNSSDPVREARRLREEELRAEGFGPGDPEWDA